MGETYNKKEKEKNRLKKKQDKAEKMAERKANTKKGKTLEEMMAYLDGRLIGVPDLFDPEAGLVGEYQGEDHKDGARHRKDVEREERFRDHGLELFEVAGGDLLRRHVVVARMRRARARAKFLPPESRAWTLETPPWRPTPETLDAYLLRTGVADLLWRT